MVMIRKNGVLTVGRLLILWVNVAWLKKFFSVTVFKYVFLLFGIKWLCVNIYNGGGFDDGSGKEKRKS